MLQLHFDKIFDVVEVQKAFSYNNKINCHSNLEYDTLFPAYTLVKEYNHKDLKIHTTKHVHPKIHKHTQTNTNLYIHKHRQNPRTHKYTQLYIHLDTSLHPH